MSWSTHSSLPCRAKGVHISPDTHSFWLLCGLINIPFFIQSISVFKLGNVCITVKTTQKSWIACMMYFLVNGTLRNIFLPELPAVLLTETLVAMSANSSVSGSRVNVKTLPHAKGRFLRSISQCHSPQTSSHAWWQPGWHCLSIPLLLRVLWQTV